MRLSNGLINVKGVFPESARERSDTSSAELVEKGIALQEIRGTRFAAEYLKSHWICLSVALRVLGRPSQRRNFSFLARWV